MISVLPSHGRRRTHLVLALAAAFIGLLLLQVQTTSAGYTEGDPIPCIPIIIPGADGLPIVVPCPELPPSGGLPPGDLCELFDELGFPPPPGDLCNDPPVANAGADVTVPETPGGTGTTVTLDGTGSTDPDGDALTYAWASASLATPATGASPVVTFLTAGTHTVTLTVTDTGLLTDDDDVVITITVAPSTAPSTPPSTAPSTAPTLGAVLGGTSVPSAGALPDTMASPEGTAGGPLSVAAVTFLLSAGIVAVGQFRSRSVAPRRE